MLVVVATGYWDSPLAFSLLTAVAVAGFARGFGFGLRIAAASLARRHAPLGARRADVRRRRPPHRRSQWAVEVLLVALVAGYARRISGEADQRQILAMDRLGRLADANALLFQLHQVTQTLPASLDLDEVLDATMEQLKELFDFDAVAVLVLDDTDGRWHTLRREGTRPPTHDRRRTTSPARSRRALRLRSLVSEQNLLAGGGPGLSPSAASGLYAVLPARGSIIGLVSIEHREAHHFTEPRRRAARRLRRARRPRHRQRPLVRPAAHRRRRRGAHPHRPRPPRPHRPVAGLPRLRARPHREDRCRRAATPPPPSTACAPTCAASSARCATRSTTCAPTSPRARASSTTLEAFLERVKDRSGLVGHLRAQETGRLPILQERELWRIAQEAVTNVERHARATQVTISWRCDGTDARLEVADDGIGFPVGKAGRLDSYGLLGMRERAASIGATLVVDSEPGRGTRVRCTLDAR